MTKIRFKTTPGSHVAEIHAKRKDTGKYAKLGTCHIASVSLIKRDGIKAHLHLVSVK